MGMRIDKEVLVFGSSVPRKINILRIGAYICVTSTCCTSRLLERDTGQWECSFCEELVSEPVYGSVYRGLSLACGSTIDPLIATNEALTDWVAAWCGLKPEQVSVTVEA